jgi:hypothetical protein
MLSGGCALSLVLISLVGHQQEFDGFCAVDSNYRETAHCPDQRLLLFCQLSPVVVNRFVTFSNRCCRLTLRRWAWV